MSRRSVLDFPSELSAEEVQKLKDAFKAGNDGAEPIGRALETITNWAFDVRMTYVMLEMVFNGTLTIQVKNDEVYLHLNEEAK